VPGVKARAALGTIWRGSVEGLSLSGLAVGDVSFTMSPSSLLQLQPAFRFKIQGPVFGSGRVKIGLNGDTLISTNISTQSLGGLTVMGAPFDGKTTADIERLHFGRNGCRDAQGRIETAALSTALKRVGGRELPLSGTLSCDAGSVVVKLQGINQDGNLSIELRLNPKLAYASRISASGLSEQARLALASAGFANHNGAMDIVFNGLLSRDK
jgi:hypothetical protein